MRQGRITQRRTLLLARGQHPLEKLIQRRFSLAVLHLLWPQEKGKCRDWVGILSGGVCDGRSRGRLPSDGGTSSSDHAFQIGANVLAGCISNRSETQLMLNGKDQFDISNRVRGPLHRGSDTFVVFHTCSHWPVNGETSAHRASPFSTDLGQIVRPGIRSAAAVRAMDHDDVGVRQWRTFVHALDEWVVPLLDLAKIYAREGLGRELEVLGETFQVVNRNHTAQYGCNLRKTRRRLRCALVRRGHVGSSKV